MRPSTWIHEAAPQIEMTSHSSANRNPKKPGPPIPYVPTFLQISSTVRPTTWSAFTGPGSISTNSKNGPHGGGSPSTGFDSSGILNSYWRSLIFSAEHLDQTSPPVRFSLRPLTPKHQDGRPTGAVRSLAIGVAILTVGPVAVKLSTPRAISGWAAANGHTVHGLPGPPPLEGPSGFLVGITQSPSECPLDAARRKTCAESAEGRSRSRAG